MLVMASLIILGTLCYISSCSSKRMWYNSLSITLCCLCIVLLFALSVIIVGEHTLAKSEVLTYKLTKEAVEQQANSSNVMERAVLFRIKLNMNRRILNAKYWNDSLWFDWFISDEFANLELLR